MINGLMRSRHRAAAPGRRLGGSTVWAAGLLALLVACGGSGDRPEAADNIVDADPSDEASGSAAGEGVGTTLTAASGMSATYRGAVVQQSDTDDPANPVLTTLYAAFDVSVPEGEREFFSGGGFVNSLRGTPLLRLDASGLEECENPSLVPRYNWGQGHGSREFLVDGPVTLTFIHCFGRAGSDISLEELAVAATLDSADGSERATMAVVGAPLDDDVLDDVASSIAWLHEHADSTELYTDGRAEWEPNVFGQATFDRYYGDGGLESFDTVGEGPPSGDSVDRDPLEDDVSPGPGAAPTPPPPDADQIEAVRTEGFDDGYTDGYASGHLSEDHYLESYDDPDPSLGEYDVAYDDGYDTGLSDGEATAATSDEHGPDDAEQPDAESDDGTGETSGTGDGAGTTVEYPTAFGPADNDFAEFEIARSIVEGMQTDASEFQDCAVTPAGYPCIDVRGHTHADGRDHRMVVSVRLGAATETHDRDLWLVIENADPAIEPWIVTDEWWVEEGDQPGWAM